MDGTEPEQSTPQEPQPIQYVVAQQSPAKTVTRRTRERVVLIVAACAAVLGIAGVWIGVANVRSIHDLAGKQEQASQPQQQQTQGDDDSLRSLLQQLLQELQDRRGQSGGTQGGGTQGGQSGDIPGFGDLFPGRGSSAQEQASTASASESRGVVIIDTAMSYQGGEAAGTGMILTSDGYILTNHHVIAGATDIRVTDPSTGTVYTARLVGADATHDVALLKLEDASGLTPITVDTNDTEAVGDAITAVGNASGGGVLMAADGTITNLDATVTTNAEGVSAGETLTGTIEIQADVVSGDSGGALLDEDGEVIGMNTAASMGTSTTTAYAIPIEDALKIASQIKSGKASDTITLGYPAFLGIGLASTSNSWSQATTDGATVGIVYGGTPAAKAGLAAGDVITAVNGTNVTQDTISTTLKSYDPGDKVTISWIDANGASQSATVTLIEGPAA